MKVENTVRGGGPVGAARRRVLRNAQPNCCGHGVDPSGTFCAECLPMFQKSGGECKICNKSDTGKIVGTREYLTCVTILYLHGKFLQFCKMIRVNKPKQRMKNAPQRCKGAAQCRHEE